MIIVAVVLFLGLVCLGLYLYLKKVLLARLPSNAPRYVSKSETQASLLCAGDSNTHGNMGYNWVGDLQMELPQYQIINAGVNADLALTLQRRLSEIIALQPSYVTLLIGTNDVNASMNKKNFNRYVANSKIKESDAVSMESFDKVLSEIVAELLVKTQAKVALISLPLIGENVKHQVNIKADKYSEVIQKISSQLKVDFLDFRSLQKESLQNSKKQKPSYEGYFFLMQKSLVLHYFFKKSWDTISQLNGTELTHDLLHQNKKSASLLKSLIFNWVMSYEESTIE